jgi:hypothetical protein
VHPLLVLLPLTAILFLGAVLGTDHLARPLSDEEKQRFGALLREHDYPGQRLVALRFAYKLTRNRSRAQDLMGRVDLRLVRSGWNPAAVSLVRYLCRLVWSEWTHDSAESDKARRAEKGFFHELEATEGLVVPSIEKRAVALETDQAVRTKASVQLEKPRASFEKDGDEVNLLWLKSSLEGETDMQRMAAASDRDATEFYAASKRRKRAVQRLLANDQGVDLGKEDA